MRGKPETTSPPPLLARLWREYKLQSKRPLSSLALILPLLVVYEVGVVWLGPQALRNGADVWLRQFLEQLGFVHYFLLPLITVSLLLAWHHLSRQAWSISGAVVMVMFAECAVWALGLMLFGRLQLLVARELPIAFEGTLPWTAIASLPVVGRLIGFAGAGVYEEVMFRMLLVPPVFAGAAKLGWARGMSVALAVIATSLIFSAAHYWGPRGEVFEPFGFWFRFVAGGCFAVLFIYRGFGIAAGTHALYDVFVSLG